MLAGSGSAPPARFRAVALTQHGDRGQGSERLACDAFSRFTESPWLPFMTTGGGTRVGLPAVERNVMTQHKDRKNAIRSLGA
jgi:hypothetical protein